MDQAVRIACQGAAVAELDELTPFQGELKNLSEENYERLKGDILKLGFSEPVSVWEHEGCRYLLNGHQRVRTLQQMRKEGFAIPPIPVNIVQAGNLKEAKLKVLSLTSQFGEMQKQGLYEFMSAAEISMDEIESMFRFPEIKLSSFRLEYFGEPTRVGLCDPDEVPEKVEPRTRRGDLFRLGDHHLLCGDSTVLNDLQKLMAGAKADLIVTDPPYNVAYTGKTKDALTIENDGMGSADFFKFLYDVYSNMLLVAKPGAAIYVAHADVEGSNFRRAMSESGWLLKQCLIWVKQSFVMGRQDYHWQHEPILYGWAPGAAHNWYSDRKQSTVLNFARPSRNEEHPTMKPVDLIEYLIGNSSARGDIVLDTFGGSGTTLVAAEKSRRRAYLMELDPKYCDVIVARWERYTGDKAQLLNPS